MTKVVRGAGRAKAAARKRHNNQEERVVGGKRDDALKAAAEAAKKPARKRAPAKPKPPGKTGDPAWNKDDSLGSNVDRLKNAGVTWKGIGEMANANGIEVPWPDGGRLLRARKQFLAGTEGQERPARSRKVSSGSKAQGPDGTALTTEEKVAHAMGRRSVPWDGESTPEEIMALINGKSISWVNLLTGGIHSARVLRDSKHNRLAEGKDGPYISFVSVEGPFMNVSLRRIIEVSH